MKSLKIVIAALSTLIAFGAFAVDANAATTPTHKVAKKVAHKQVHKKAPAKKEAATDAAAADN